MTSSLVWDPGTLPTVDHGIGWLNNEPNASTVPCSSTFDVKKLGSDVDNTVKRHELYFQLIMGVVKFCVIQFTCKIRYVTILDCDPSGPTNRSAFLPDSEFPAEFRSASSSGYSAMHNSVADVF